VTEFIEGFHVSIPTSTPTATLASVVAFLDRVRHEVGPLAGIGIAAFGPVDLNQVAQLGRLLETPKAGWSSASLIAPLERFGCPIAVDTDVNAAALAERILMGGGTMNDGRLLPPVRAAARTFLNGYLPIEERAEGFDRFITAPALGERAGIVGAMLLAGRAARDRTD
jgi:predicted NBD/HSP70 family sugar kinase